MDPALNILSTLDDDCLLAILKQDHIGINDLIAVALSCTHLRSIAQQAFRIKFRKVVRFNEMNQWSMEQFENYLRCFGELLETFTTDEPHDLGAVLQLLAKYCKNLVHLHCSGSRSFDISLWKVLCGQLKTIEYDGGVFKGTHIFGENAPLQSLRLYNCVAYLPAVCLPNLTDVSLILFNRKKITSFFELNPQISRLNISLVRAKLNFPLEQLVNLEELSFASVDFYEVLDGFNHLVRLKKLRFGYNSCHIREALSSLNRINAPLETLTVHHNNSITPEIIDEICQFSTIKRLRLKRKGFSNGPDSEYLLRIINNLSQLEEIRWDLMLVQVAAVRDLLLEQASKLQSALFTIEKVDNDLESSNIDAISTLARAENIDVKIEVLLGLDAAVSVKDC